MKSKNETPQPSTTYNGWSNYETWATALWLDNEQSSHAYWREQASDHVQSASECEQVKNGIWTQERAAVFNLADQLKDSISEESPLAEQCSLYSDLLTSALDSVDWQEIATNVLSDIEDN